MAHFVKERSGIVKRKQSVFALGKVVVVGDNGYSQVFLLLLLGQVFGLGAKLAHPGTSRLELPGIVVVQKDGHQLVSLAFVSNLVGLDGFVVGWNVVSLNVFQSKELVGNGHDGIRHTLEAQVGLHQTLVEIILGDANLFCIVPPIPGLDAVLDNVLFVVIVSSLLLLNVVFQFLALVVGRNLGLFPDIFQQLRDGFGSLGHSIDALVFGKVFVAVQFGLFLSQFQNFRGNLEIVPVGTHFSPGRPGFPCGFPEVTAAGKGQKGLYE
mmetsp:Transcript_10250/g.15049  ORF Transcript_10250/g.15049 Transcript_10250/m.15049 type:complete len:267 (-) Transcript_10250:25-825(-)